MVSGTSQSLYALWGSGATDVFAAGSRGTVLRYDGKRWTPMTSGTTRALGALWGSGSSDVYATGQSAPLLHYDGKRWVVVVSAGSNRLFALNHAAVRHIRLLPHCLLPA